MKIMYSYPPNGGYADTVATVEDSQYVVNTQYRVVSPLGDHADDCDMCCKIGGVCNCGRLDGIDVAALIEDARENGKFGAAPRPEAPIPDEPEPDRQLCPSCGTYCYGDCEANQ